MTYNLRVDDKVVAKPGTTSAMWAEGEYGVVAQSPSLYGGSRGLVRWNKGEGILMGFSVEDIEPYTPDTKGR